MDKASAYGAGDCRFESTTLTSWPQDGSKSRGSRISALAFPFAPLNLEHPNLAKPLSTAIRNLIMVLILMNIDFWNDLVPISQHFGTQALQSWDQIDSKIDPN